MTRINTKEELKGLAKDLKVRPDWHEPDEQGVDAVVKGNGIKKEILDFLSSLHQKYGYLPKFAHNSNNIEDKVLYSGPFFDDNELAAAIEALLFGKWSSSGEISARFEKEFSKRINQNHSFFCNSGSSANLLMIKVCKEYFKWKDNDEIIVSPVGFPTSVSTIIQNNLKPVFIDIEWNTLNFDLDKIEEKITERTKAILLSPVVGNPPDINKLLKIVENKDIKILLDNCDSLGSKWNNKYLNEYALVSSCSFYPAHEITTLEGGMVSSNIEEIIKITRSYATWGRDCYCIGTSNLLFNGTCGHRFNNWLSDFPDLIVDHRYVFNRMGYNFKPLDLQAAIGLEQLKKLDYICQQRRINYFLITTLFAKYIRIVKHVNVSVWSDWVPFGVPLICDSKEEKQKLVNYLESNRIQTRNYFAGNLLMHSGYKHLDDYKKYPEANKVLDLVFFVGCGPTISEQNINYIEKILRNYSSLIKK